MTFGVYKAQNSKGVWNSNYYAFKLVKGLN